MRKVKMLCVVRICKIKLLDLVFVWETLCHERYHESSSLPSQSLG